MDTTAVIKLKNSSGTKLEVSAGNCPIETVFQSINAAVGMSFEIESFSISKPEDGSAVNEARIRINKDGITFSGRGLSENAAEAAVMAYLNGINRYFLLESEK
jgi:2-isopropylmalate synthase